MSGPKVLHTAKPNFLASPSYHFCMAFNPVLPVTGVTSNNYYGNITALPSTFYKKEVAYMCICVYAHINIYTYAHMHIYTYVYMCIKYKA